VNWKKELEQQFTKDRKRKKESGEVYRFTGGFLNQAS
jgi:hypothetical protein